jgi:hypothetical protein
VLAARAYSKQNDDETIGSVPTLMGHRAGLPRVEHDLSIHLCSHASRIGNFASIRFFLGFLSFGICF